MSKSSVVEKVIEEAGGGAALAAALSTDGRTITPQAISDWKANDRIPGGRVLAVEKVLKGKVTRHQMRPDLYPEN